MILVCFSVFQCVCLYLQHSKNMVLQMFLKASYATKWHKPNLTSLNPLSVRPFVRQFVRPPESPLGPMGPSALRRS